jgi:hypothetical protein
LGLHRSAFTLALAEQPAPGHEHDRAPNDEPDIPVNAHGGIDPFIDVVDAEQMMIFGNIESAKAPISMEPASSLLDQ